MRFVWFLLILALVVPAQAVFADTSWYVGGGGAVTRLRTENFASTSGLTPCQTPTCASASSGEFSDTPTAWQVFGAFTFDNNFGFLVKYSDTGTAKDWWQGMRETLAAGTTTYNFDGQARMKGTTLYVLQTIPMGDKVEYTIQAGWTFQDLDLEWTSNWNADAAANPSNLSLNDNGLALAAVLRYKFLKWLAVSGELEYLVVDFNDTLEKPIRMGVNLEFHF
jgi:hypothetical protein